VTFRPGAETASACESEAGKLTGQRSAGSVMDLWQTCIGKHV